MKKIIQCVFCIILFSSFFPFKSKKTSKSSFSKKETTIHEIISVTAKTLKSKHSISPMGFGASALEQVEDLSLMFQLKRHLTIEEGRVMIVDCVEELLKNINQNQELRPYLKNYPFAPEDVGIIFYVYDQKGYDYFYPDISIINAGYNRITYKAFEKSPQSKMIILFEESYEDAIKLVKKNKEEMNSKETLKTTTDLIEQKSN